MVESPAGRSCSNHHNHFKVSVCPPFLLLLLRLVLPPPPCWRACLLLPFFSTSDRYSTELYLQEAFSSVIRYHNSL
ncbi:hypothetical protein SprV_0200664100 [Sparganum proliferum]